MKKRVVITGLGAVSPIGNNVPDMWEGIKTGRNGVCALDKFDVSAYTSKVAGMVKNFDPTNVLDRKEIRRNDDFTVYAMAASMEAYIDSKLKEGDVDPTRMGVILGNGVGGFYTLESDIRKTVEKDPMAVQPLLVPKIICNIAPAGVAIKLNAQGPCYAVVTACSSGTDALAAAARWIQEGVADVMVTGGTEAPLTPIGIAGFCVLQALSTDFNDNPEKASRPFDKDRCGFVIAEGSGIVILEELEHALKRGAHIYAEVAGYGISCDAYHMTAPRPDGLGGVAAMKMAIQTAGLQPEDIDYINAHGTSTQLNDPTETKAIKDVFGDHAYKLKVSSTKSMTGHLLGGAGGLEAVITALAIENQYFPQTKNLDNPDPECDLDYVANAGQKGEIRAALSNSLGFGGHNGILCLKKFDQ
ncbi:MAG: beta-ketoacyl-ACP synthase II [Spirochaetales bacterium]|nr:beta-ketoacyl-ACP synthase II [Spirochaetales bacterium]